MYSDGGTCSSFTPAVKTIYNFDLWIQMHCYQEITCDEKTADAMIATGKWKEVKKEEVK